MSRELLCRIGAALYGEHWHSSLAHDLSIPRRIIQRWAAGDARPPPTLRRDLARLRCALGYAGQALSRADLCLIRRRLASGARSAVQQMLKFTLADDFKRTGKRQRLGLPQLGGLLPIGKAAIVQLADD